MVYGSLVGTSLLVCAFYVSIEIHFSAYMAICYHVLAGIDFSFDGIYNNNILCYLLFLYR